VKLYVANASQQNWQFNYWLPETPRSITEPIIAGSQIWVAKRDLPSTVIDSIIQQHRVYGLGTVQEALRDPNFSGLAYSIDRPVSQMMIIQLATRRQQILVEQGRRSRQEAAVATDASIMDLMQSSGLPGRLEEVDMSVQEVEGTRDPRDDSPEVSEGVLVTRRSPGEKSTPRSRGQGRRAARRAGNGLST
jgi:hypothetical protein